MVKLKKVPLHLYESPQANYKKRKFSTGIKKCNGKKKAVARIPLYTIATWLPMSSLNF